MLGNESRGPDLRLSISGDTSEEMALNQGAEGWDGDVKKGGDRRGEETAGQVKGHTATITCHLQGRPEKGICPQFHDYPAETPSLRKKGLKDLDRKSFPY